MVFSLVARAAAAWVSSASHCLAPPPSGGGEGPPPPTLLSAILNPPPFHPHNERFDSSTYAGRACHFLSVLGDLSTLLLSREGIEAHLRLLRSYEQGERGSTHSELWRARKVKEAVIHPETGEVIPAAFRFSAFAPVNLIICAGLLASASSGSLLASAGWQWVNQSYNVGVNYANRSSGSPPVEKMMLAYMAATSTAVTFAVGMQAAGRALEARLREGAGGGRPLLVRGLVRLSVPMLAVSIGSCVNLYFTRQSELQEGVMLTTSEGYELGHSHVAARQGLAECATTRVLWTLALLTLTPIASAAAVAALPSALATKRTVCLALDLAVSFSVIWLAVPLCIAIYPQRRHAKVESLEPRCHSLTHPISGETVKVVWFNKGL